MFPWNTHQVISIKVDEQYSNWPRDMSLSPPPPKHLCVMNKLNGNRNSISIDVRLVTAASLTPRLPSRGARNETDRFPHGRYQDISHTRRWAHVVSLNG